jgi:hypothetical protein
MVPSRGMALACARQELLDHVIVLDDQHLGRLAGSTGLTSTNPGTSMDQGNGYQGRRCAVDLKKPFVVKSALGGLHHDYRRAASASRWLPAGGRSQHGWLGSEPPPRLRHCEDDRRSHRQGPGETRFIRNRVVNTPQWIWLDNQALPVSLAPHWRITICHEHRN